MRPRGPKPDWFGMPDEFADRLGYGPLASLRACPERSEGVTAYRLTALPPYVLTAYRLPLTAHRPSLQLEPTDRAGQSIGCLGEVSGRRGDLFGGCVELLSGRGDLLGRCGIVFGP
jgi:hypothetical protein